MAWPDNTAILMTAMGQMLWTFSSVEEAAQVCRDWYDVNNIRVEREETNLKGLDCRASFMD
ncbi:MAG TPA: hypothetical protein ENJ22_02505 [Gammaproteobacteria bacterium]|nr:hypothetical protein [Gammaproteobacteria bacterium]